MVMNDNGSRERMAWVVLLVSFTVWLALLVAIPVSASRYLQVATRPLALTLQANQGTVRWEGVRQTAAIFAGDPPATFEETGSIVTNAADAATLLVYAPDGVELLARVQVYGNTTAEMMAAEAPRFGVSSAHPRLNVDLDGGRLRFKVPENGGKPIEVTVLTPHGSVRIPGPGQVAVEVSNVETQVVVLEGQAELEAAEEVLVIRPDQRGEMGLAGPPAGPLSTERNLLSNGDFEEGLAGWEPLAWRVDPEQPEGTVEVIETGGETALRLHRVGEGHADGGVRQLVNQDVTDSVALRLEVSLRLLEHTLGVCGSVGSECPLTVEIRYDDIHGNEQVWRQGFFAQGTAGAEGTPEVCITCGPPRPEHVQAAAGQIYFYRGDLLELMAQHSMSPPRHIRSIWLLVAGHTFDVEVLDVSLVVAE